MSPLRTHAQRIAAAAVERHAHRVSPEHREAVAEIASAVATAVARALEEAAVTDPVLARALDAHAERG